MHRAAFLFLGACFLMGMAGCKPNTDLQTLLETAKTAVLTGDTQALGDSVLALLKSYLPPGSPRRAQYAKNAIAPYALIVQEPDY